MRLAASDAEDAGLLHLGSAAPRPRPAVWHQATSAPTRHRTSHPARRICHCHSPPIRRASCRLDIATWEALAARAHLDQRAFARKWRQQNPTRSATFAADQAARAGCSAGCEAVKRKPLLQIRRLTDIGCSSHDEILNVVCRETNLPSAQPDVTKALRWR